MDRYIRQLIILIKGASKRHLITIQKIQFT